MNYKVHPHHLVIAFDAIRIDTDTLVLYTIENVIFLIRTS